MDKILFNKLKDLVVEVYSYEDYSKFDVGKIISADNEWVLLQIYDSYGLEEGLLLLR